MDDSTLQKIWSSVGLATAYLSLNFWSYTQQWRLELPALIKFNAIGPTGRILTDASAVYGILLTAPLLIVLLQLTRLYARRRTMEAIGLARLPVLLNVEADPASSEGWWFQAVSAVVILVFPLMAQVHFFDKFLDGEASNGSTRIIGLGHYTPDRNIWFDNTFRYDSVSYYPFFEPWLLLVFELTVLWLAARVLWALFRPSRADSARRAIDY
jgi:hypothetical protein